MSWVSIREDGFLSRVVSLQPLGQYLGLTFMGFPDSSVGKEPTCNAGDPGSIPGSGRSAGEGIGYPLQYSWGSLVAQLGRPGFNPCVGKIPWRKEWLHTPVFWPGEFHGLYSLLLSHFSRV